jgi:hypothetical protein
MCAFACARARHNIIIIVSRGRWWATLISLMSLFGLISDTPILHTLLLLLASTLTLTNQTVARVSLLAFLLTPIYHLIIVMT